MPIMKKSYFLLFLLIGVSIFTSNAQTPIPSNYYGINAWMPDSSGTNRYYGSLYEKWQEVDESGVGIVRVGGIGFDRYFFTDYQLLEIIDSIQAIGAEVLLQVPIYGRTAPYDADYAADIVEFVNITHNRNIKYWSIGNEPNVIYDAAYRGFPSNNYPVSNYAEDIKDYAAKMKAVDTSIKIVAGDLAWFYPIWINALLNPGGADDVSGTTSIMVGGVSTTIDYIDYFSFHYYPFSTGNPADRAVVVAEVDEFVTTTNTMNSILNTVNTNHSRNNDLKFAVTEININTTNPTPNDVEGVGSNGFMAGQWWADMLLTGVVQGNSWMTFWSAIEGGDGSSTDNGFLSQTTGKKKPIYYHLQLCAQQMTGTVFPTTDNQDSVAVHSVQKASGGWAILVLNYDVNDAFEARIRLDNQAIGGTEPLKINVNGGVSKEFTETIPANSTTILQFSASGYYNGQYSYDLANAQSDEVPQFRMLNPPVPTLSEWGLVVLALCFMVLGTVVLMNVKISDSSKKSNI